MADQNHPDRNFDLKYNPNGKLSTGNPISDEVMSKVAKPAYDTGRKAGGVISDIIDAIVDFFD